MRRAQSEPDCTISKRLSDAKFVIAILLLLAVLPYLAAGTDRGVRRLFQKSKAYPNPQADPVVVIHTPKGLLSRLFQLWPLNRHPTKKIWPLTPELKHGMPFIAIIANRPRALIYHVHCLAEIHPRLDLEILINDPELRPQLDLLVQAYTRLQERPTSSPLSYFQIAGIHGQPYQVSLNYIDHKSRCLP